MGKFKMLVGLLFFLVGLFSSCSSADDVSLSMSQTNMTKPAVSAKEQFVADLKVAFGNVKKGEKPHLSMEQVNYLEQSAKRMLKAEGMFSKTMKKLEKQNPAALILTGTLYLGLSKCMESAAETKAESTDSISGLKCDTLKLQHNQSDTLKNDNQMPVFSSK